MNETLMTEAPAATTTEGQPASQSTESTQAPAGAQSTDTQQQASEGQTAEGQQAQGEQTEAKAEDKPAAPEKYEFKAPEGKAFDEAVLTQFSEVAKELNLPQDAAQKILDKVAPAIQARQAEAIQAARTEWANTARIDKEFGGDKLPENLAVAKKALDTFGTPELRALLNESGLGNHPEVIRLMYRAGKAISEDGFVPGSRTSTTEADPAKRLFPNQA